MDIRRINQIKENSGRVTGNRTPVKIVKNKVAAPFTECDLEGQIKKIVHVSGGTDLAESVDNEQNTPI